MGNFKDINGRDIQLGDEVIVSQFHGSSSHHLCKGRVIGFTPKMVKVKGTDYYYRNKDSECKIRDSSSQLMIL